MPRKKQQSKRKRTSAKPHKIPERSRKRDTTHSSSNDRALRQHLLNLLDGGNAHLNFAKAVADFPPELCGLKPNGVPYSAWQLLEHLRIAQRDILEFSRDAGHVSPKWPEGFWPSSDMPPDETAWQESVKAFRADLSTLESLAKNPSTDLFARIPHGDGQTILREVLLAADHNAYHIGQLVMLRRLLGAWTSD